MKITNEKLYELCRKYGAAARFWRQKFIGLLPEVNRRRLYKEKGFSSIFEFAFKLAGVSERQVCLVLNLERKFIDKPDLHKALTDGEVSVNKLARVASIATIANQQALTGQVKILSQKAVETFIKDEKFLRAHHSEHQSAVAQVLLTVAEPASEPVLSPEVKAQLFALQSKGIDINEIILEALKRREEEIANIKQKLADEQEDKEVTRHIPVKIERVLNLEYGTKCAVPSLRAGAMPKRGWPNCRREAKHIYHELPFAMVKNHNPFCMKPLCKEHHEIAHGIDFKFWQMKERAIKT